MQREPSPSAPHRSHFAWCALARTTVCRSYERTTDSYAVSIRFRVSERRRTPNAGFPERRTPHRVRPLCAGAASRFCVVLRVACGFGVSCGVRPCSINYYGVVAWCFQVSRLGDPRKPRCGATLRAPSGRCGATPRADPQAENHIHHHSMHACTHLRSEVERAPWGRSCRALLPGRLIVHHKSCRQSSGAQSCRRPSDTRASSVSMFVGEV